MLLCRYALYPRNGVSCCSLEGIDDYVEIPSYEACLKNKKLFAKAHYLQSKEQDPFYGKTVVQKNGSKYLVQNPAPYPLTQQEMDAIYDLDYQRTYHPSYEALGGVPAIEEVRFSIISCRGCFGSCSFCCHSQPIRGVLSSQEAMNQF